MIRLVLFSILLNQVASAPIVGRKLLSNGPSADAIVPIVLVCLLFGPFILWGFTGLFRSKNMCFVASCCDKICPKKILL